MELHDKPEGTHVGAIVPARVLSVRADTLCIACIQAEASGAKMRDLQEPADDHDVLQKMDHLILVGEIPVKEDCRCQSEHGEAERDLSRTKTEHQQQATTDLEANGNRPAERSQLQAD